MNFIDGAWAEPSAGERLPVVDPATAEVVGEVPLSSREEVDRAAGAYGLPRLAPYACGRRVQYLFKLKALLERISRAGPVYHSEAADSGRNRGEMRRAIENVEVACGCRIRATTPKTSLPASTR
jgi:malonate-semialdehyde dehydrogenase (acetylating)/methylmalonate-semialdehyde dehydrogenase